MFGDPRPQGFVELFNKEKEILKEDISSTQQFKLSDVYQRIANGYAVRISYQKPFDIYDVHMHKFYYNLYKYHRENAYDILKEKK